MSAKRKWAGSTFIGLMGLASLLHGASQPVDGCIIDGIYFLSGGVMCLLGAALGVLTSAITRRRSTRLVSLSIIAESGEAAVVIPYSMGNFWLFLGVLGITTVNLVALGSRERSAFYVLIAIGFAILSAFCFVQICRKRVARGYLAMSPGGICHRSWRSISFASWEQVSGIEPGQGEGQLIEVLAGADTESWSRPTTRLRVSPSRSAGLTVRGMFLSVDPVLVYYALLFYLANPEARSELGGDAGVERLRNADIPVSLLRRYAYRATTGTRRQLYGLKP